MTGQLSVREWAEIFIQDLITKETKPLATASDMVAKLTQQCVEEEYCVVTNSGLSYTTLKTWIIKHFPDYVDCFEYNHSIGDIKPDRVYKIIGRARHDTYKGIMLYLVQDMDTEQVFIIEEDGISKTTMNHKTLYWGDNIDSISLTVDCELQRSLYENILKGEERNMDNKIVNLYYERKKEEIKNKYVELLKKEYEELPVVVEYNELVNTFEASLDELATRYNTEDLRVLIKTGYTKTYTYELNNDLKDEIKGMHREEFDAEMKMLELLVEEVRAQLSLSDDKDYQVEILTRYGILDKKGKLSI